MRAAIITISDGCSAGTRCDSTMPLLRDTVQSKNWHVVRTATVPDRVEEIQVLIATLCRNAEADVVITTGGTGVAQRDVTPEAVRPLLDKEIPGLAELMRLKGFQQTEFAALSRSLAGCIGKSLVLCLPGSPRGARESLEAVIHLIPHTVDLLRGQTEHT